MAKIKLPYWLDAVWGKVQKNNVVFRRAKKTIVLESDPTPSYTRTDAQAYVRSKYYDALKNWYSLSESDKKLYNEKGSKLGLSGWNVYVMETMKGVAYQPFNYEITINNSQNNNTLTDYQVLLNISNDSVFFSTIQDKKFMEFYDEDKQTLLNHYVELWDNVNYNAKIWIKIPNIPASSTKKVYLKCNATRTIDLSNPDAVFDFFDDFNGTQLDLSKWNYNISLGSIVVQNSQLILNGSTSASGGQNAVRSKLTFGLPIIVDWRFSMRSDRSSFAWRFIGVDNSPLTIDHPLSQTNVGYHQGDNNYFVETSVNGSFSRTSISAYTLMQVLSLKWRSGEVKFVRDYSTVLATHTTNVPSVALPLYAGVGNNTGVNSIIAEWVRVRKYSYPEPSTSYLKL